MKFSYYFAAILFLCWSRTVDCKISQEKSYVSITNTPEQNAESERQHNQEGWLLGQIQANQAAQWQASEKQGQGSTFGQTGPFNFYTRIHQVIEVAGLGLLWIRTFSIATGVPYFYPVLMPLLLMLCIVLSFIPNEELNFPNLVQGVIG